MRGFYFFSVFSNFVLQQTCHTTRIKNTFGNASEEVDMKFLTETLMGEMRKVLRVEME